MPLKSPSLFWRTFTLLMLLLIITALAWLQSFRVLSEVPFSKGVSQQIISTVNLTRYALISSDPNARPDLLHVLAYREGVRIIPKESSDTWKPLHAQGNIADLIDSQTKKVFVTSTIVAAEVHVVKGTWLTMLFAGDDPWYSNG